MNKSNGEPIELSDAQANRLIHLFRPSFESPVNQTTGVVQASAMIWHPMLTDIHQQIVHSISPVLIQQTVSAETHSPTLSLTLLPAPADHSARGIDPVQHNRPVDELAVVPKPTL